MPINPITKLNLMRKKLIMKMKKPEIQPTPIKGGRKSKTGLTKEQVNLFFKKVDGPGTKREIKQNLKQNNLKKINIDYIEKIMDEAKKQKNPTNYLLTKGLTIKSKRNKC